MTAVSDVRSERAAEIEVLPDAPRRATESPGHRLRRTGTLALLAVVAVLAVYAFFSAFVTHLWFDSRQRSLAGEGLSLVKPKVGTSVGVLQASEPFTLNVQLVQGDGTDELRAGPGHRVDTPLPGAKGNSVIYGREGEWGAPFRHLDLAVKGTELYLRTPASSLYGYTVIFSQMVPSSALGRFIGPSDDYRLTLITDAKARTSAERWVVVAVSGTVGHASAAPPGTSLGPERTSSLGRPLVELLVWVGATVGVVLLLRRSYSRLAVTAAATPLAVASLVALFLEISLLWNPLA